MPKRTIFLVNAVDNPHADVKESAFVNAWSWQKAPSDWKPQDGIQEAVDAIIVFSKRYKERQIEKQCEAIREETSFVSIPLLVGVSQFEMPLANRVKELSNAGFVFTPIDEKELIEQLEALSAPPSS